MVVGKEKKYKYDFWGWVKDFIWLLWLVIYVCFDKVIEMGICLCELYCFIKGVVNNGKKFYVLDLEVYLWVYIIGFDVIFCMYEYFGCIVVD